MLSVTVHDCVLNESGLLHIWAQWLLSVEETHVVGVLLVHLFLGVTETLHVSCMYCIVWT